MASTRAVHAMWVTELHALWVTELADMRKTTSELESFLYLLTPTGEMCAFMSIKGELSWSDYFGLFGQTGDDPRLDDFKNYVVPLIQEAMKDSVKINLRYGETILSAEQVVKKWVEQVMAQTLFIATEYWNAIHRIDYTDMDQVYMFKRRAVIPATFSDCFPRIHAWEMALSKQSAPLDSPYCYTPQTPSDMEVMSTDRNHQAEMESIRQAQVQSLLVGGVGCV